ncbi:LysM peptidoglycan-binding domain-containing protein [Enterococcus sp. BWR-S5]|uniref:LysM peptidoglycan-binding domain-containing protein n=1 Tax=Enterococcus sp. BWR-S5 TaxID=2787714 RepID=UPI00192369F3|nr:LysM peptidoglycan-binding domain-containing protein [Enterococcus sp. BWR-S5]MBL1223570.1 LysM peptidoglycan-binding domain-containing protein [Enterococcus sp. BWR-S5]
MKKNSIKAIVSLFFFSGIIGLATYFVSSTQIEGSTPETSATSSEENKDAEVTATSVSADSSDKGVEDTPASEEQAVVSEDVQQPVEPERETEIYTVQQGQNLWEIAQSTEMSLQDLMNTNQLSSSAIFTGQELLVKK